jgi:hypothetical protein
MKKTAESSIKLQLDALVKTCVTNLRCNKNDAIKKLRHCLSRFENRRVIDKFEIKEEICNAVKSLKITAMYDGRVFVALISHYDQI